MDNIPAKIEDVKDAIGEDVKEHKETIKREVDSLDDFEHLGHDSSPLKDVAKEVTGDLLGNFQTESATRDLLGEINKGVEKVGSTVTDELLSFDPLKGAENLFDKPLNPSKMDSNLLDMTEKFPDRKEADDKLDKFLHEMSQPFAQPKAQELPETQDKYGLDDFKSTTQNFMDNERGPIEPATIHSNDSIDRYSDSEPDVGDDGEDFTPSKYGFVPKKNELPESFGSTENFKTETFKDVEEFEPAPPHKDHPVVKPKDPAPEPPKVPEPVKEPAKAPEPVKPKTPEPVVEPPKPKPIETKETKKEDVKPVQKPKAAVTDAEAIFCKMGLVESLIYWRDPKKSGPVFGGVLVVLLALTYFSLISVIAYLSLLALSGTIAFRIYKNIVQAVQKTGDGHPFKEFLDIDISLSQDKVKEVSEVAVAHLNAATAELRRLFLVEDLVDSIKFGVLLWAFTYLGAWFNGMTLIIIAWVALFSLPKVYETNKTQIDANLEIVRTKVDEITSKVKAAIPIGKKGEEKKEQ
ncbi:reticulon-4 isoform X2 [Aethina tumida]|uniref:reticulon-4 isoform X2 n=1 Tax=Aethina tumida TaxID=116153 RepID=UPI00096AEFF1|nr:reticulon-4 isoform X2 [Aethina tumida]